MANTGILNHALKVLDFVHAAERLKCTLRHGWTSDGRQESVAEHSWRLSLLVMLCYTHVDQAINIEKALGMAIIHDLPEIITGDVPFFEIPEGSQAKAEKHLAEDRAMSLLCDSLDVKTREFFSSLWKEYIENKSAESKLIRALDKIEAQIQQNEADFSTWNEFEKGSIFHYLDVFCDYDEFVKQLKEVVVGESVSKLNASQASLVNSSNNVKTGVP